MRPVIASLVVLTVFSSGVWAQSWGKIKVGEPFPFLSFPSLQDGKPMSLHDFYGKKVILHVFASW